MKKILAGLGVILAACLAVVFLAIRDSPPPDTTGLAVMRMEPAPERNAFPHFMSAANAVYWPTNMPGILDYLDGASADPEALAEVLARNRQALEHLDRGLACPACSAPEVAGFVTPLPYVGPWRNLGRILAIKTRHARLAGRPAEAAGSCIALLRFGDLIQRDPECLIQYLVGLSVLNLGLAEAQDLARDGNLPDAELARLSAALAELGPFAPGLVRAIQVEYKLVVTLIDELRDGRHSKDELLPWIGWKPFRWLLIKPGRGWFFKPNGTKAAFADQYRALIADAPAAYADMKGLNDYEAPGLKANKVALFLRPNAVGRILPALLIPSFGRILEHRCRMDCDLAAARLLVALHQSRRADDRFPDRLEALVPAWLPAVPADPFDGRPFRYAASKKILYAVGKDLRDSGGSTHGSADAEADRPSNRRWETDDVVYGLEEQMEPVAAGDVPAARAADTILR